MLPFPWKLLVSSGAAAGESSSRFMNRKSFLPWIQCLVLLAAVVDGSQLVDDADHHLVAPGHEAGQLL